MSYIYLIMFQFRRKKKYIKHL